MQQNQISSEASALHRKTALKNGTLEKMAPVSNGSKMPKKGLLFQFITAAKKLTAPEFQLEMANESNTATSSNLESDLVQPTSADEVQEFVSIIDVGEMNCQVEKLLEFEVPTCYAGVLRRIQISVMYTYTLELLVQPESNDQDLINDMEKHLSLSNIRNDRVKRSFDASTVHHVVALLVYFRWSFRDTLLPFLFSSRFNSSWACHKCDTISVGSVELEKHLANVHRLLPVFPCDLCSAVFERGKYVTHWVTHFYHYRCERCGEPCRNGKALHQHSKVHKQPPSFRCCKCGKVLPYRKELERHEEICGTPEEQTYALKSSAARLTCHICGVKVFNVRYHCTQYHTQKKRVTCPICGKTLKSWSMMLHHKKYTHEVSLTGKEKCKRCDKEFDTHAQLVSHRKRYHRKINNSTTQSNQFICSICGKSFKSKYCVYRHVQIHNTKNDFPCPQCGKHFKSEVRVRVHLDTHTGVKKYKCPECGREIRDSGNYAKHMKIHRSKGSVRTRNDGPKLDQSKDVDKAGSTPPVQKLAILASIDDET